MKAVDATVSWTYSTATIRQANANTANQLNFLQGVAEDDVEANVIVQFSNSGAAGSTVQVGVGLDATNAFSGLTSLVSNGSGFTSVASGAYRGIPAAGRHFASWNEWSSANPSTTWVGTSGNAASGIQGSVMA
jgi:hypothetical protein